MNTIDAAHIFRALQYRNYRLYFIGQGVSLIGSWMQSVAMSWLVYRITRSAFLLGFVGFTSQIPSFFFGPLAGVLADRWNKHRILIATQTLLMIQAFILAFLVLMKVVQVWHILALSIFLGAVNAFDMPTRQSFVIQMVEKKADLGNAIALNSMMFNGARLIGPSIAGLVVAAAGEGVCFFANAVSFMAVIVALFAMKLPPQKLKKPDSHVFSDLKDGFSYAFGSLPIRTVILLIALISLTGTSFQVLMPVFAKEILHGGPHTLGFLMGAVGIGAVAGAFFLASRRKIHGLEKVIPIAATVFSLGLISLSRSRFLPVSLVIMVVTGFGMMLHMVSSNTLIQTVVEEDKRGRVMSLYTMAFMGITPFGSLLSGSLASAIGVQNSVLIGGFSCMLGALVFARQIPRLRKAIHPIFVKKGILPPVASGIQTASELTAPPES